MYICFYSSLVVSYSATYREYTTWKYWEQQWYLPVLLFNPVVLVLLHQRMHLVTVHYVLSDLLCSIGAANMPYTKLEPIHVQKYVQRWLYIHFPLNSYYFWPCWVLYCWVLVVASTAVSLSQIFDILPHNVTSYIKSKKKYTLYRKHISKSNHHANSYLSWAGASF